jgi:hypothetical protein
VHLVYLDFSHEIVADVSPVLIDFMFVDEEQRSLKYPNK